ncbi:WD repeat-containing protein 5 [Sphaceloma murrayae]|uniref:Mitochondrial division protein 1 n=1 Tax=Sphaceloma murrayae TaxID=2082308 RepID=A0A2K1QGH4_9PEZI|nr:WD repeat-containing protein 5 [Sphaceloma murrayae]
MYGCPHELVTLRYLELFHSDLLFTVPGIAHDLLQEGTALSTASIMSVSAVNPGSARPRSPKRKRSYDDPNPSKRTMSSPSDDPNGYAYEDSPLASTPSSPPTPAAPLPPQRPTSLTYSPLATLHGHRLGVSSLCFSPDGALLATASADATIKLWTLPSFTLLHTLEGHLAGISTLSWNPDSTVLASGSDDKTIRLWDVKTGKCYPTSLLGHSNYVYSVAFSPKGNMLASGSYDEAVFLWDVRTARVMRSLPAHSDPVSGIDFVRDGTLVASCSSDGLIRIWDSGTGQCLKTLVHEDHKPVGAVRFSPNGKFVVAATLDSTVRLWNYVEGRVVKTYFGGRNEKYSAAVCFGTYGATGEDGTSEEWGFIAMGDQDGVVRLWDVNSKEVLWSDKAHEGPVLGVDTSPDSALIATGGLDGKVKIWKLDNGKAINGQETNMEKTSGNDDAVGHEVNGRENTDGQEKSGDVAMNGHV